MTVIGLDLSLRAPGWFYREPTNGDLLHGTFFPKNKSGMARIDELSRFALSLLPDEARKGLNPSATLVVIEGFSLNSRGSSLDETHGLGYIVRYALWHRKIRYIEVTPTQLKKFATGNGSSKPKKDGTAAATKEVVIREVYKRWGVNVGDNNEADAYVLGRIGMHLAELAPSEELTAFQRDVLKGIKY